MFNSNYKHTYFDQSYWFVFVSEENLLKQVTSVGVVAVVSEEQDLQVEAGHQ